MKMHVRRSLLSILFIFGSLIVYAPTSSSLAQTTSFVPARVALRAGPANKPSLVPPLPQSRPGVGPASATFNVTYNGFTQESRAAFQYAVDIWASQITSPVPINVVATWEPLGTGILGSAGPTEVWLGRSIGANAQQNVWYPVGLANKLAGRDLNTGAGDIEASFSSNFGNWYFGTDGNTPLGTYDFVSVVLHELGHGLGFVGSMRVSGSQGSWGYGSAYPFIYDNFAENGKGTSLLNTSAYPNPSTALAQQLTSNDIFWDGTAARSAAGGAPPKLYIPSSWQPGSSYAHLDESTYRAGDPNSLMTPQIGQAEAIHDPGAITRGMFTDMGWTVQVPQQQPLDGQLELNGGAVYTRDANVTALIANRSSMSATGYALRDGTEPTGPSGTFTNPTLSIPFTLDTSDGFCRTHTVYGKLFDSRGPSPTFSASIIYDPSVKASLQVNGTDAPATPDPLYTRDSNYQVTYQADSNECSGLKDLTVTYQSTPNGNTPAPRTLALTGPSGTVSIPFPASAQEGRYEFSITTRDNANNSANGGYVRIIDHTRPTAQLGANDTAPTQENRDGVAVLNLGSLIVSDNLYKVQGSADQDYWGYRVVVKKTIDGSPTSTDWRDESVLVEGQTRRIKWNMAIGLVGRFVSGRDYVVYVQFLDGAGNPSNTIKSQPITVDAVDGPRVFMPVVRR